MKTTKYTCRKCQGEPVKEHGLYCENQSIEFGTGLKFWKEVKVAKEALRKAIEHIEKIAEEPNILAVKDAQNEMTRAEISLRRLDRAYCAGKGI